MELHPYFERGSTSPQTNMWYVLATDGDSPSMRVGSTATFIDGKDNEEGRLYVIGGANPDGTFAEINLLDLSTMTWDRLDTPSRISRYEHAVSTCGGNDQTSPSIIVFGGAVQTRNLNDIQKYSVGDETWSSVTTYGPAPCARTQHSMSAYFSDGRLVVFGGGVAGVEPVSDRQTYIFEPSSSTWSVISVSGQPPKARHGHLILASSGSAGDAEKVYMHGGMIGQNFYDDLHVLDLTKSQWSELQVGRSKPCGRAAHGGAVWKDKLYVFGGMCGYGALDDMWSFDIGAKAWTEIKYDGPPPPSRLDFACCLVTLRTKRADVESLDEFGRVIASGGPAADVENGTKESGDTEASESKDDDSSRENCLSTTGSQVTTINEGTQHAETQASSDELSIFFLVMGGMDTQGTIFDDTLIFLIDHGPLVKDAGARIELRVDEK